MRKAAVLALPELGEFLHDVVDGVHLGFVAVDNQGYFLFRVHSREYMKKTREWLILARKNGF